MVEVGKAIISLDVFAKEFVCDLHACKGACCEEGDSGAPLEKEELEIIDDIYENVKPYLPESGIKAIEKQGKYIVDSDGDYVTPLVNKRECAYTIYEQGIAKCGIEKAYFDKKISWRKPISCHLYPIRIKQYADFDAVNYDKQDICSPARACGAKLKVPVYKFLKEPLIRKYGIEWYSEVEDIAKYLPQLKAMNKD